MSRNAEQIDADDNLRASVQAWIEAYGGTGDRMLTDFIFVAALQGFDDEGTPTCATFVSHAEAGMPGYRILGLLDAAQQQQRANMIYGSNVDDEDE